MTEFGRLKKQAVQQRDQEQDFYLCNLIESLIACISVVSERRHESLICELYTIPLWDCTEVCCVRPCLHNGLRLHYPIRQTRIKIASMHRLIRPQPLCNRLPTR